MDATAPNAAELGTPLPKVTPHIKIQCVTQPHATPYALQVDVALADVQGLLDQTWETHKTSIPASGFRPGSDALRASWESRVGMAGAYSNVWSDLLHQAAAEDCKFILDIIDFNVAKTDSGFRLIANVYFAPEVVFNMAKPLGSLTKVPEFIPVEVYSLHPVFIAQQVDQAINALVKKHQFWNSSEGPIQDGTKVQVSLSATLDGVPWPQGSGIQELDEIGPTLVHPEELYRVLLGKQKGDKFEFVCESMPNIYGPNSGKRFTAEGEVLGVQVPAVESMDAILQRTGAGSESEARALTEQTIVERMLKGRETSKYELAVHYLRTNSTMSPTPSSWLRSRAEVEWVALLTKFKGKSEKEVLALHGVKTKSDVLMHFMAQSADLLREQLTMVAFAAQHQFIDYSLSLDRTAALALDFMLTKVQMTEVDPVSVRKKEEAPVA